MIVNRLFEILKRINIKSIVQEDVPMTNYTTFNTGGNAEIFITAKSSEDIIKIYNLAMSHNIPLFILGEGANILVSDKGIPGITLYLGELNQVQISENTIIAESGVKINTLCESARDNNLSGLEFIYGMPGTLGGAIWMNARCYGSDISSNLLWVEYLDNLGLIKKMTYSPEDWDYKISPFQSMESIILKAAFKLSYSNQELILKEMTNNYTDRKVKGHFNFPCAGSIFKNNRNFGSPTGKIIEDAGLKGLKKGNSQISDFHGNIIVNLGGGTSSEIDYLIKKCINDVDKKFGFVLEPEVLYIGDWD